MRVLVAEDEAQLARYIARGLTRHGMAVDVAADGELALRKAHARPYDVVVLDRDLPLVHGDEVCRRLLHNLPETRVLMLTAAGGLADRVEGLTLGADDYLGKPFAFLELVARVRALARRGGVRSTVLVHDDLSLDTVSGVARRDGRTLCATPSCASGRSSASRRRSRRAPAAATGCDDVPLEPPPTYGGVVRGDFPARRRAARSRRLRPRQAQRRPRARRGLRPHR